MKQIAEFRIGYDERFFGPNDDIEKVLEFLLKKAGTGKRVSVRIIIDD